MNKEDLAKLLEAMHAHNNCGCDCGCPTDNMFEANAAQFANRASNTNAAAMESFQLAVAAQNAILLKMQSDSTKQV